MRKMVMQIFDNGNGTHSLESKIDPISTENIMFKLSVSMCRTNEKNRTIALLQQNKIVNPHTMKPAVVHKKTEAAGGNGEK